MSRRCEASRKSLHGRNNSGENRAELLGRHFPKRLEFRIFSSHLLDLVGIGKLFGPFEVTKGLGILAELAGVPGEIVDDGTVVGKTADRRQKTLPGLRGPLQV